MRAPSSKLAERRRAQAPPRHMPRRRTLRATLLEGLQRVNGKTGAEAKAVVRLLSAADWKALRKVRGHLAEGTRTEEVDWSAVIKIVLSANAKPEPYDGALYEATLLHPSMPPSDALARMMRERAMVAKIKHKALAAARRKARREAQHVGA